VAPTGSLNCTTPDERAAPFTRVAGFEVELAYTQSTAAWSPSPRWNRPIQSPAVGAWTFPSVTGIVVPTPLLPAATASVGSEIVTVPAVFVSRV
jgi:hypothetical protein